MPDPDFSADAPKLTPLGRAVILLFIVGCVGGGLYLLAGRKSAPSSSPATSTAAAPATSPNGPTVQINIAYGTEKERWLKWAAGEFAQTKQGANIRINLLPYGSLEGA